MDPYHEQRLREEVIYLHSLWHQGPPISQNPIPYPITLRPINSTQFKKRGNKPGKRSKINSEPPDSGIEWPCEITTETPPTDAGWPSFRVPSNSERPSLTLAEQARLASGQAQKAALKAVSEFFVHGDNSDDEDDVGGTDEVEDRNDDTPVGKVSGNFDFFEKLFKSDSALREYYEKNNAGGDFSCLVCYAVGKRALKRHKDCVALVQHSVSITKTKRRQAHRAYGQAICKILGWDINRLPSSIASLENILGSSSNNKVEAQENGNDSSKDALNVLGSTAELVTINSGGPLRNENFGTNNGESAPLEGNIDNCVKNGLKLPDFIMNHVNGNSGELSLQNKSFNNDNLQDNVGSGSAALEE